MRIIAGTARGRKIFSVSKNLPVKPISDRIKQSLFDILRPRITASYFLDLFSGTGNVGLEALSRGALKVVSVDKEIACTKNMQRNLKHLGFEDRAQVVRADVLKDLGFLNVYAEEGYDIIFMGPPYRDIKDRPLSLSGPALESVAKAGLLAPAGMIALQNHKHEEFKIPEIFEEYRTEKYGDTLMHFLRHKGCKK